MPSLRNKITLNYYLIATLFIVLVLFTFVELRLLEEKITIGAQVTDFFDTVLEIRRFEKNYFLYHQTTDYEENQAYLSRARALLQAPDFPQHPPQLSSDLQHYEHLMQRYHAQHTPQWALAIREAGKSLVSNAELIANNQRAMQRDMLTRQRHILMGAAAVLIVAVLVLGQWLSWQVVQPLRQMEIGMKVVAEGNLRPLALPSRDREILLLQEAFNRMLEEIDRRQHFLLRSEKLAALGTLLSGVAHELNNPLSNISTSCQILLEELENADPVYQQELLAQIDEQTNRARTIVRSLLDFTRVREFQRETLELNGLLQETVQFLKGQVPTQLALIMDIPAGIRVDGDKQRLQQVFLNLLKNALEAAGEVGEVRLCAIAGQPAALPVKKCFSGKGVCIEITDNGAGIPPAVLPRIFDPFFTTKDVGHGSGLGLFIAHDIIEEHGGCIRASNRPQGGAVFTVWLPLGNSSFT